MGNTAVLREKKIDIAQVAATRAIPGEKRKKFVDSKSKHLLYGYDNMARSINDFMWEGRPGRSKKRVHSSEEMVQFLEKLAVRCWENYNNGLESLVDE